MNAPATTNETSPESHSALPEAWVERIFRRLSATYGRKFADQWSGSNLADVKALWAKKLSGYSGLEISCALNACDDIEWPPDLPAFRKLCRPPVDFGAALSEAIAQTIKRKTGEDSWTHPAIFWAARSVTSWELENRTKKDLEAPWRAAFGAELAKGEWEEVPKAAHALPAPGDTHSREVANAAVEQMATAVVQKSGLDPLLWAKRPQSQQAWDAIVRESKVDPRFKEIVEKHVADGVCSDDLQIEYVWSFAAQKFVRPAWYVRANGERAAA